MEGQYDRLMALDTALGFPGPLVYDGLDVTWPPIDTARRDAPADFGLSALTSWFAWHWQEDTAEANVSGEPRPPTTAARPRDRRRHCCSRTPTACSAPR
jgi:hypothetical protein